MRTPSEASRTGMQQIVEGHYGPDTFTRAIEIAIFEGWADDCSDPYRAFSDGPIVGVIARLTDEGEAWAREQGWICQCAGCDKITLDVMCPSCRASAQQYGVIEDCCGMHYVDKHPEVLAERTRLWVEGVKTMGTRYYRSTQAKLDRAWIPKGVAKYSYGTWVTSRSYADAVKKGGAQ